jgi:hypothetical protein
MFSKIYKILAPLSPTIISFAVLIYSISCEDKTLFVVVTMLTWILIFLYCMKSNNNDYFKGVFLMAGTTIIMGLYHFPDVENMPEPLNFIYVILKEFITLFSAAISGVLVARRLSTKDEDKNT